MVRHKEASTRGPSKGWTGAGITQMGPSKKEEWIVSTGHWQMGLERGEGGITHGLIKGTGQAGIRLNHLGEA